MIGTFLGGSCACVGCLGRASTCRSATRARAQGTITLRAHAQTAASCIALYRGRMVRVPPGRARTAAPASPIATSAMALLHAQFGTGSSSSGISESSKSHAGMMNFRRRKFAFISHVQAKTLGKTRGSSCNMAHVMGNRRSSRLARGTRAAPTWTKLILASVCMLVGVVGALASRDMAFGSSATHGIAATAHKLLAATRGPRRPRTCSIVASATGDVLVRSRKEGADAHWDNLMRGTWGDFHGRFCRWDPGSLELLIETHLLRSYHIHGEGNNAIFRQDNKIFFDDERGTVARGPWDVKKPEHCTEKGFIHPRVGFGQGTTFVMTPPPAQATAWAVHKIAKAEAVLENGIMKLGKGYEGEGYMVEMIVSHGAHIKLSVGYIYDYVSGALKHVTFNREDNRGWPSAFWTHDVRMFAIDADSIDATLGLPSAVTQVLGTGHQV